MPEDTFRYSVELDTQGLSAQLASVRHQITQGVEGVSQAAVGGIGLAGGAFNQASSDIITGQQLLASSTAAQFALPPVGVAQTALASSAGMPQTFMQEVGTLMRLTSTPVGVFPEQARGIAAQRLNERIQNFASGFTGAGVSVLGGTGGMLAGAAIGQALIPIPFVGAGIGGIAGAIGGSMLADVAFAPIQAEIDQRMADRARLQQVFGFNKFTADERDRAVDSMRQNFTQSLFSPEEFNAVLPSAQRAGFFRGMGGVGDFANRFSAAEQFFTESAFTLGVTGPEGIAASGEIAGRFQRMGVSGPRGIMQRLTQARVLSQQMRRVGEFTSTFDMVNQQMQIGQAALSQGMGVQGSMETFARQATAINMRMQRGGISDEQMALLGGDPTTAAANITGEMMGATRAPISQMLAVAFAAADPEAGTAEIDRAALEDFLQGGMDFSELTDRISRQFQGPGGTEKLMTVMANRQRLAGQIMEQQGQIMGAANEKMAGLMGIKPSAGTQMFMMQKQFGVGEAASRTIALNQPMEQAAAMQLQKDETAFQKKVGDAIEDQKSSLGATITRWGREVVDGVSEPLDDIFQSIANSVVPALDKINDQLGSMNDKISSGRFERGSPISAGVVMNKAGADDWMSIPDPNMSPIYRAAAESRVFPGAMMQKQIAMNFMSNMTKLPNVSMQTEAGA